MIVVQLKGGLGNQMFQYAFSKNYALRGHKVYLDLFAYRFPSKTGRPVKYELASLFNVKTPELPEWSYQYLYSGNLAWRALRKVNAMRMRRLMETDLRYDETYLHHTGNVWFSGYFQNENYFKNIAEDVRRDFTYSRPVPAKLQKVHEDILNCESVSIHVRRGDFLTTGKNTHGVLPLSYYRDAIAFIQARVRSPKYFVFTDDADWVRGAFSVLLEDYVLVEHPSHSDSLVDIFLMTRCKHNVTANSSFSWWGAWLNDNPNKLIVAPKQWCIDPVLDVQTADIPPSRWHRI